MAAYTAIQSNVSQSPRRTFKTNGTTADNFYQKEGYLVKIDGVDSDGKATVSLADAKTDKPIGVLLHGPASSTTASVDVDVLMLGSYTIRCKCGTAITAGDDVGTDETNTDGTVQTAVATQWPIGIALCSAVAGDYVEVLPCVPNTVHA